MALVTGIHLHGPIGPGLDAGEEDFPISVRLIPANGSSVPIDLEGDAAHGGSLLIVLQHPQTNLLQILEHQRAGGNGIAVLVQLQLDLLNLVRGHVVRGRDQFRHGVLAGFDVLTFPLGGVPPLDGLQDAVLIGVKLVVPIGHRGELEGSGANPLVGICVTLKQNRLAWCRGIRGIRRIFRLVSIGEGYFGGSAAADKFLTGEVGCAAGTADIGQQRWIVFCDFKAERRIGIEVDVDCFAAFQRKFQA